MAPEKKKYYYNRELSWMDFNARVLEEAQKKDNPIMGFYACADRIIVTGDSVSMACEACGSGKPVLV